MNLQYNLVVAGWKPSAEAGFAYQQSRPDFLETQVAIMDYRKCVSISIVMAFIIVRFGSAALNREPVINNCKTTRPRLMANDQGDIGS